MRVYSSTVGPKLNIYGNNEGVVYEVVEHLTQFLTSETILFSVFLNNSSKHHQLSDNVSRLSILLDVRISS